MGLEEALEVPGFWMLGGGAVLATVLGWRLSGSFGVSVSWWQVLIFIVMELLAAAFFATRDS